MSHRYDPPISDRQRQIVLGTVLGGSSLVRSDGGKNYYLSMRGKDVRWLRHKAGEIGSLASETPFTEDTTTRWHSMCYPIFGGLHAEFYKGRERRIRPQLLDGLKDVALAVWYGDSGSFEGGRIVMNTQVWGKSGSAAILRYFGHIGYRAELAVRKGRCRVMLDPESSSGFYALVEPQLPYWFVEGTPK